MGACLATSVLETLLFFSFLPDNFAEILVATLNHPSDGEPTAPTGLCVQPGTGLVWVAINDGNIMAYNQSATVNVTQLIASGDSLRDLSFDSQGQLWVVDNTNNMAIKFSVATVSVQGVYPCGTSPVSLAIDGSDNVWCSDTVSSGQNGTVTKINNAGALVGIYNVGPVPVGLTFDSNGNCIVAISGSNQLTVLSPAGAFLASYDTGAGPVTVAVDSKGNIFSANSLGNSVTKLDSSGKLVGTYSVGTSPGSLAVDNALGCVWVTNQGSNTVIALNTTTGANLGSFQTGSKPIKVRVADASVVFVLSQDGKIIKLVPNLGKGNGRRLFRSRFGFAVSEVNFEAHVFTLLEH